MDILISNEQLVAVNEAPLIRTGRHALEFEAAPENSELSIALVDEQQMQRLNAEYRGKDTPTDVLSFATGEAEETPATMPDEPYLIGDVVICPAIAAKQAAEYGQTFEQEMALLLVHGILHLLGYDHETDEDASEMEAHEHDILAGPATSSENE
ncbi:MAG TPA: rRNA maturation RNase YbeY [Candidatus Aquicultor sp.]|jgi:probable rRNA maturation factor